MHDQPISRCVPSVSARREQIDDHAHNRRNVLELVGAQQVRDAQPLEREVDGPITGRGANGDIRELFRRRIGARIIPPVLIG